MSIYVIKNYKTLNKECSGCCLCDVYVDIRYHYSNSLESCIVCYNCDGIFVQYYITMFVDKTDANNLTGGVQSSITQVVLRVNRVKWHNYRHIKT